MVVLDQSGSNGYFDPVVRISQQLSRPGDGGPVNPDYQPPCWTQPDWAPGKAYANGRLAYEVNGVVVDPQLVRLPPSWLVNTTILKNGQHQTSSRGASSGQQISFWGGTHSGREGYLQLRYQNGQIRAAVQLLKVDEQTLPKCVRQMDDLHEIEPSQQQFAWWGWLP